MPKDSTLPEIAPVLMQAARSQLAATMARLEARGFRGLTPACATLMPLLDAEGMRSTALARRAGVTKQAMSQLVKLLEERKYVEQIPDPTDTRAKVVRLTTRGIALRAACAQVRRQMNSAALKALGQKGLAKLVLDLQKVIASMSAPSK